jgi:hypothetical protein
LGDGVLDTVRYSFAVSANPPEILPAQTVENHDLRCLLDYWEKLRGQEAMPLRAVAGAGIGRLLKFTHLSDVIRHGEDFRFRIIGMGCFQGSEPQTGRLVSEHPDMGVRARFPILMRAVVRQKTAVRGLAARETAQGWFQVESIWLPFGSTEVHQIMGMAMFRELGSPHR